MELSTERQPEQIARAAQILNTGGVVAFPTETVYGLGADVSNDEAIKKIYEIKQRPENHPLIIHISNMAQLEYWAQDIPLSARILAEHFWPGPLTLILKRSKHIPDSVTGGQNTVGIRIPAHPVALALLDALGHKKALAAPSANLYGKISPTSAAHVYTALHEKVDMILDGGACEVGLESTILGFDQDTVSVLRPGGIPVTAIESVIDKPVALIKNQTPQTRVSGSLPAHYAPATPLKLYPADTILHEALKLSRQGARLVVITWSEIASLPVKDSNIQHVRMPQDPVSYGKDLYAVLHRHDTGEFASILMETPPELPAWLAISDRLQRASYSHT
ncbi:MAG: threonylcarbamoyl-AMP synthase [Nitrosomonas sp.]|nr:threonylcarbamoyl-AMP synthase [Nitrosomonas sp.]